MPRRFMLAVLLVPLFVSSGCIALLFDIADDPMGRKAALRQLQREYTNAVRWGEIEQAADLVHPELRDEFLSYEGEFTGIRVTDFNVGKITYGEELKTAHVRVTYFAYALKAMTEVEIRETQEWERLEGDDWRVRPQLDDIIDQVDDYRL
jgi:hypothetical protein